MSKRENILLLEDMLDAALRIKRYTSGFSHEQFIADDKTVDAVIRNFEIIGEAANRVDPDFRLEHTQIEWNRIRGFRNRIVHDYFGIDLEIVWAVIEEYLDELIDWLETMLNNR